MYFFVVVSSKANTPCLLGESCKLIERFSNKCRKTETKVITLKHGEMCANKSIGFGFV